MTTGRHLLSAVAISWQLDVLTGCSHCQAKTCCRVPEDLSKQLGVCVQIGAFVPADSVRMHVFDSVFTRMGASDNLAMGRSTFLEVGQCCVS